MLFTMKLAQYLHNNGLTTRAFAARLGTTPEAVRLYVMGKRRPRADVLAKIKKLTDGQVEPNDFYDAEADEDAETHLPPTGTDGAL